MKKLIQLTVDTLLNTELARISKRVQRKETAYYQYISTPHYQLAQLVLYIYNNINDRPKKSFIDIGCGYPLIPTIMFNIGFETANGLEYNNVLSAINEMDFKDKTSHRNTLITGDLLTYDFNHYDVLYSYNPIHDLRLMEEGIINIMNTMRPGAIFLFNNAGVQPSLLIDFLEFTVSEELEGIYIYTKPLKDYKNVSTQDIKSWREDGCKSTITKKRIKPRPYKTIRS